MYILPIIFAFVGVLVQGLAHLVVVAVVVIVVVAVLVDVPAVVVILAGGQA